MNVDYQKLAEQTGAYLNDFGKKAFEISVKGVVAEAWAGFIPAVLALAIGLAVICFLFKRFEANKGKWGWEEGEYIAFWATVVVTAFVAVIVAITLHNVIVVSMAPEWAALKAIASAIRK